MNKVVLITVRDYYPYKNEEIASFEIINDIDFYNQCIAELSILTREEEEEQIAKAEEKGTDPKSRIRNKTIGKLYNDSKAPWTRNNADNAGKTFIQFKKEGIPILRRVVDDVSFYVLPCTGKQYLDEKEVVLRQQYTSKCIDIVCQVEKIRKRTDLYAIVHSSDTGANSAQVESFLVTKEHFPKNTTTPLDDMIAAGKLFSFHHIVGHDVVDNIIKPLCSNQMKDFKLDLLEKLFPPVKLDWYSLLRELNNLEGY